MRIKVFTEGSSGQLERRVNTWLMEQGQMINIISTHFSTNGINHNLYDSDDLGPMESEYHAAIYYIEL